MGYSPYKYQLYPSMHIIKGEVMPIYKVAYDQTRTYIKNVEADSEAEALKIADEYEEDDWNEVGELDASENYIADF